MISPPFPSGNQACPQTRYFRVDATGVVEPPMSGASLVRAKVESLIGHPDVRHVFTQSRVLVCIDRDDWWAFCAHCWSPIGGQFESEAAARAESCRVCGDGKSTERWASLFLDRVAHVVSVEQSVSGAARCVVHQGEL